MKANNDNWTKLHKLQRATIRVEFIEQGVRDGRYRIKIVANKKKYNRKRIDNKQIY